MTDLRIVECPSCDGTGQIFYSVREWEDHARRCFTCDGKGTIEDECPLITLDELEEMHVAVDAGTENRRQEDSPNDGLTVRR